VRRIGRRRLFIDQHGALETGKRRGVIAEIHLEISQLLQGERQRPPGLCTLGAGLDQ
jgi:hypothetical protein